MTRDLILQEQRDKERLAQLQHEIDAGFASGVSERTVEQISADARARVAAAEQRRNAA
jgi:antitoxin ParD1/3/4